MRYTFDVETDGFLDSYTTIHCLVLMDIDTQATQSFGPFQIEAGLSLLQEADLIVGHNIIKFDLPVIQKLYPKFQPKGTIRDTLLISRLIYANLKDRDFSYRHNRPDFPTKMIGKHALEAWGHRLDCPKDRFQGPWEQWSEEMQRYCEQDVKVTYRLWQKLESKRYSEQAIKLEHDFAHILFKQEQHGFCFDVSAAETLYAKLRQRRDELLAELQECFPPWEEHIPFVPKVNNSKYGYQKGVLTNKIKRTVFNPNSRDQIAFRLQVQRDWVPREYTKDGKPKIDEDVLNALDWPEARLLSEYLMIQNRISQLAEGPQAWLKKQQNGWIHGEVVTNGAVTGRCTHKNPNMAQVPAKGVPYGEDCRSLFTVPPGFKLVGVDASGLELRCLGHYLARYDKGVFAKEVVEGDIHWRNAKSLGLIASGKVFNKDLPHHNWIRNIVAKRFIYAFLYGAGDARIGAIMSKGADIGKRLKAKFLRKTPALRRLKEEITQKVQTKGTLKGLDGRLLHVRSQHSALNTLLQSAGALIVKQATVFLYEELTSRGYVWGRDWVQVAHIHDEIQLQIKEELADEIGKIAVQCFERAGEHFALRCPITAEYRVGQTWAETH